MGRVAVSVQQSAVSQNPAISGQQSAFSSEETVTIHVIGFPVKYLHRLRAQAPYAGEHATASRIIQWAALSYLNELETRRGKAA